MNHWETRSEPMPLNCYLLPLLDIRGRMLLKCNTVSKPVLSWLLLLTTHFLGLPSASSSCHSACH